MVTRFGGGLACLLASLSPSVGVAQAAEDEEAEAEVEVVGPLRRGFLAIPSLGLGIPVGRSGDVLDPGLRLGALLGGHLNSTVSLNGEIVIDVLNPKNNVFSQYTAVIVDLGFSPLLHFGTPAVEAFVGPKLGLFAMEVSQKTSSISVDGTARGLAYGLNAGLAVPLGKVALGGLLSYTGRHATQSCTKISGQVERCDDSPPGPDLKILSISAAVMF